LSGIAGGVLGGVLSSLYSSGITSAFGSLAGTGLTALGSILGNTFNAGMKVGSSLDWENAKG